MCTILRRELRNRGELAEADATIADLRAVMARFTALRSARLDDELLAPLEAAMRQHDA